MTAGKNAQGLETHGYDLFIGRVVLGSGDECFVNLCLIYGGEIGYRSLQQANNHLCYAVRAGQRVLLTKSPGSVGSIERTGEFGLRLNEILSDGVRKAKAQGLTAMVTEHFGGDGPSYILPGRRYEPFTPEQMIRLRDLYSQSRMNGFPDPFQNQPK